VAVLLDECSGKRWKPKEEERVGRSLCGMCHEARRMIDSGEMPKDLLQPGETAESTQAGRCLPFQNLNLGQDTRAGKDQGRTQQTRTTNTRSNVLTVETDVGSDDKG
jgi:hypothetical protein